MITERIDHTLLRADATEEDIRGLCEEAVTYGFHSVCVNSSCVALCASLLKNTGIKVCTVIGFPLGAMSTTAKIAEATAAVKDGAEELDMVIHIGALKSGNWDYVRRDIGAVVAAAGDDVIVKVILETCLLTDEEIQEACLVSRDAGADWKMHGRCFMQVQTVLDQVPVWRLQKLRCLRYIRYEHLRFFHSSFSDCVHGYISRNVSGAAFFLCNTLRSTFTKDNLHSRKRLSEQNYFFK